MHVASYVETIPVTVAPLVSCTSEMIFRTVSNCIVTHSYVATYLGTALGHCSNLLVTFH